MPYSADIVQRARKRLGEMKMDKESRYRQNLQEAYALYAAGYSRIIWHIWAAQYGGTCDVAGDYQFWQCAEDGRISGIKGPVDHDIWYIEPGKVYATNAAGKKEQVSIGECEILLDAKSYKLKDNRAKPKIAVMYGDKKLHPGKDYMMSYVRNTTSGTGYVIVQGIGKYKDWTSKAFTIE